MNELETLTTISELLDRYIPTSKNHTTAVLVAAGSSSRYGTDKLWELIDGRPVISYTLDAYQSCPYISEIIVVTKKEKTEDFLHLQEAYHISKMTKVVVGGETRQDSVRNGVMQVSKETKFVAIADGARCLTTPEQIAKVCIASYKSKAATAAHQVSDTMRYGDHKNRVVAEVDRNNLWSIQTPQVFHLAVYLTACEKAKKDNVIATDDETLVYELGHTVKLVECGSSNVKLTTKEDLQIVKATLNMRKEMNK